MNIYELDNIKKEYKGKTVLDIEQLSLEANKLIAIVGNSGSGKSTLLKILGAVTKPEVGRVGFEGKDITKFKGYETDRFFTKSVDIIFQEYNLIENLTVFENLSLLKQVNKKLKSETIKSVMKSLKIDHLEKELVKNISGGEAQRTAIARTLLKPTKVILADEPTGALDIENTNTVMKYFRKIANENNTSIIFVTHDLKCAAIADIIYIINDGKIIKKIINDNPSKIEKFLQQFFILLEEKYEN